MILYSTTHPGVWAYTVKQWHRPRRWLSRRSTLNTSFALRCSSPSQWQMPPCRRRAVFIPRLSSTFRRPFYRRSCLYAHRFCEFKKPSSAVRVYAVPATLVQLPIFIRQRVNEANPKKKSPPQGPPKIEWKRLINEYDDELGAENLLGATQKSMR